MRLEDVKVGMRVRVLPNAKDIGPHATSFNSEGKMDQYLGEVFTVDGFNNGTVEFKEIGWCWAPEWLEPAEEEEKASSIKYKPMELVSTTGTPTKDTTNWVGGAYISLYGDPTTRGDKDSAGGINMIDKEKEYVDAGIEVDEERLREDREVLVETLRAEFWKPHIGGQMLFNNGHGPAAEGTLLALSPSRERMKVAYSSYSDEESEYFPRDEWLNTTLIIEFLPATEHPTVEE